MPLNLVDDAPKTFPKPEFLTLDNFKRGVITLIDKSRLPKNALEEATNLFLVEDGQPSLRPGTDWFGTAFGTSFTTAYKPATAATSSGSGTVSWTTPTNAYVIDAAYATVNTTSSVKKLAVSGFSFNIPLAATITNLEIQVTGKSSGSTAPDRVMNVAPITTDTPTAQTITLATTDSTQSVSGMFGLSLTPAQVNDPTFGAYLQPATGGAGAGQRDIDQLTMRVTYTYTGDIDGFDYYDTGSAIHLIVAYGGNIYRSTDDGATWTLCTGATYTPGHDVGMNQYNAFLYLTTGVDQIYRYDGTTTLQVYTSLSAPAAPTVAATGLAGTTYTVYYKISAVSAIGFSIASTAVSQAVGAPRENWDNTSNFLTLTLPAPVATQSRVDIYYSTDNVNFYYIDSVVSSTGTPGVTYKDNGQSPVIPSTTAPTDNTTQGPTVAELVNVGSRMYGVRDPNHKYRIWFTSGSAPYGAFASGYDGGYLDWQPGGKYFPVKVADYRDGKGTPLATVWCDSADGQGCILQMSLDTLTVGNISITVPSAYKLPGSRGTPSPGSVVNVLNDYMFYNTQAFYNLGSRPQLLQILSTDEVSANIRPTIKTISTTSEAGIASVYYDAKVYFSVGYSSTVNNYTAVYDTERKAWLPTAFTLGFKKFLRYTDNAGGQHLLAVKPGDAQLTEISSAFQGDYGVAFETSLLTGLYQTNKDRFGFQFTEEMEFEYSNPTGTIYTELLGISRQKGFTSVKTVTSQIDSIVEGAGWDSHTWDSVIWDDTSSVPVIVSESSVKRYTPIQQEMNAVQFHVYTNTLDANYILRTLQTWGTDTNAGHPSGWRV